MASTSLWLKISLFRYDSCDRGLLVDHGMCAPQTRSYGLKKIMLLHFVC